VIAAWEELVKREVEAGTGASIALSTNRVGRRTALQVRFEDLEETHGPVVELKPYGLRRCRVELGFGRNAGGVIRQIGKAGEQEVRLARALVDLIGGDVELDLGGQTRSAWVVLPRDFRVVATTPDGFEDSDEAVAKVCREVVVPLMAAMAELIGYEILDEAGNPDHEVEGEILASTSRRRERSPRNRLLCLRIHGERCVGCGFDPKAFYGEAGGIIEVHHIEALSLQEVPRPYDPAIDLVPLCPNCHRAVHSRRPVPLGLDELRAMIESRSPTVEPA